MKRFNFTALLTILISVTLSQSLLAQYRIDEKEMGPILKLVDKGQVRDRIKYLADDKLKGRLPGSPGYQMAVDFVVEELKKLKVTPSGENGFVQNVLLRKSSVDSTASEMKVYIGGVETRLRYGRDFALAPDLRNHLAKGEGSLVFAGYGIQAPHLSHDDYKDIDVRGKVVLVLEGTPDQFPAGERAHFNLPLSKCEAAARAGAAGLIVLVGGNETNRMQMLSRSTTEGVTGYVTPDGSPFSTRVNLYESLNFLGYLRASYFQSTIRGHESSVAVRVSLTSNWKEIKSENIVGVIQGTDPVLKDEYVVHTAHIDHVGIGVPVKGDSIYNGAHDNASGTACLIEMAKLYKKSKLRRSVLIVFVTSEEKGLLGSGYFASHPTVPADKIVANINTDMPTLIAPLLSIEPLGAEHSSLMNEVKAAADFLKLEVREDHMPEQVRFVRSDQYSFIRKGIPALHIKYGLKTDDPALDLRKKIEVWTAEHYHQPSDEFRDEAFDFDAAATYIRLNFLIGWQVANRTERPAWNEGDFFGLTFGKR